MDQATPASHIKYQFQKRDFVALTRALTRKPMVQRAAIVTAWLLLFVLSMWAMAGSLELFKRFTGLLLTGAGPWWLYPMLLLAPLVFLFDHYLWGLVAGSIFKNNALANQEVEMALGSTGIENRAKGFETKVAWDALRKIIETKDHLVLAISKREALVIPRRAFDSDEAYQAARNLIVNHAGSSVPVILQ